MSFVAPFPGGGKIVVAFQDHQEQLSSAFSFTFTGIGVGAAAPGRYVGIGLSWLAFPIRTVTATINGIAAIVLVQGGGAAGHTSAIIISSVPIPAGTSVNVVATFSGGVSTVFAKSYSILGLSTPAATSTASNGANAPTATLNVPANGSVIGIASAGAGSTPVGSWTGINLDNNASQGAQTGSCASENFVAPQTGLVVTCTFSPFVSGNCGGVFAAFGP